LVRRIAQGHPRALGIDIVFSEPDRLSPPEIARELLELPTPLASGLAKLPPSERDLASAMQAVPTVLAVAPSNEENTVASSPMHPAPIRQAGNNPAPFLITYKSLLQSLPQLSGAAHDAVIIWLSSYRSGSLRRAAQLRQALKQGFVGDQKRGRIITRLTDWRWMHRARSRGVFLVAGSDG